MLSIVIPAHNEASGIARCVVAASAAAVHPSLRGEQVKLIVVADACTDNTAAIATEFGATVIKVNKRNVGAARRVGAKMAIQNGARWLAFTDADTIVSSGWLVDQLLCAADVVCGTISVDIWPADSEPARRQFAHAYKDMDGHRHVHGANLGVLASAYQVVGGFKPLIAHEDVGLVGALQAAGFEVCWSATPRVQTSARLHSKTGDGFGATLRKYNAYLDDTVYSAHERKGQLSSQTNTV